MRRHDHHRRVPNTHPRNVPREWIYVGSVDGEDLYVPMSNPGVVAKLLSEQSLRERPQASTLTCVVQCNTEQCQFVGYTDVRVASQRRVEFSYEWECPGCGHNYHLTNGGK